MSTPKQGTAVIPDFYAQQWKLRMDIHLVKACTECSVGVILVLETESCDTVFAVSAG